MYSTIASNNDFIHKIPFHSTENCTDEFVCYMSLYTHLTVEHAAQKYTCPHCFTTMTCSRTELIEHFNGHPYGFEEYECLFCESGFKDVDKIRKHISRMHPANFLFIGSRITQTPQFETDEPQIVYIGNTCDISSYTFAKCNDVSALVRMDPNELNPSKQNEFYLMNQSLRIKEPLVGPIPSISFTDTMKFYVEETVTLDQYKKPKRSQKPTIQKTLIASPGQVSEPVELHPLDASSSLPSTSRIEQQSNVNPIVKLQTSTRYKCITYQSATDLTTIYGKYKSRSCADCLKFMKLDDHTGLTSYLEHLIVQHPCKSIKDAEQLNDVKKIIQHRITSHKDEPIVYLQIEQSPHYTYKVVQCKFKCQISTCCTRFDTRQQLETHTFNKHKERFIQARIVQEITVIESHLKHEINFKEENIDLSYCTLFTCSEHEDIEILGSKTNALCHHNQFHNRSETNIFKTSIFQSVQECETIKAIKIENDQDHRIYVFKCCYCRQLFGSRECVESHNCSINEHDIRFTISKLVAHPTKQKMIATFEDMQKYNELQNPQILLTPLNICSKKCCGLCSYKYTNTNDLEIHYRRFHSKGEVLNFDLLKSFHLETVELGECFFQAGCCTNIERKTIGQIVCHVMACGKRRFICNECSPIESFDIFMEFVTHLMKHSIGDIYGKIHDIKILLALFSDMAIRFPIGLVVTFDAVSDLEFGYKVQSTLLKELNQATEKERKWMKILFDEK